MVKKIVVSAGHGPSTPGKRSPDGMNEHDFTYPTAEFVCQYLQEYEDVKILKVYAKDRDISLGERTEKANSWGADFYLSIHANAYGSTWNDAHGIETLCYSTSTSSSNGYNAAKKIQEALIQATGLTNRGVKPRPDLWEMRSTDCPAVLVECGFYTNKEEKALLASRAYQQKCARAMVSGLAEHLKLKKKDSVPVPVAKQPDSMYRVQLGAFSSKANAEKLEKTAEAAGFKDTFLHHEGGFFKVQVGAFSNYQNAKRQLDLVKNKGFKNAFIN